LIKPFKFIYGNFEARFIEGRATYSYNLTEALEPRFGYSQQNGEGFPGISADGGRGGIQHDNMGDGAGLPHGDGIHFETLSCR